MIEHLFRQVPIPIWILLVFGLFTGIGWITLMFEIRPLTLSTYFSSLFRACIKYWLNNISIQSNPDLPPMAVPLTELE